MATKKQEAKAPKVESHADLDVQELSLDAANSKYVKKKDVPEGSGSAVEQVLGYPKASK